MKTITLNFNPLTRDNLPHIIRYTTGQFLMEQLDKRINKERPALEASVANQLAQGNTFEVSTDPGNGELSDFLYIRAIVEQLDIDNLLKGQILEKFDS